MPALVVPIIAEKDYRPFRKMLRQYLPPRYESWKQETDRAVSHAQTPRADIRLQPVEPAGFAAWLQAQRVPPDLSQLNAFAWTIACSRADTQDTAQRTPER